VLCTTKNSKDAIFLQLKEAQDACAAPFLPNIQVPAHNGQRIAEGQYRLQTECDPLLGWTTINNRHFFVRQLADHKARIDATSLHGPTLTEYATLTGKILAKGHARTGDPVALSAYCGESDRLERAIARFAFAYADQTTRDHALLVAAVRKRRIKAMLGV
jgi:hypothetical protein